MRCHGRTNTEDAPEVATCYFCGEPHPLHASNHRLTLRDQFASEAMKAILSRKTPWVYPESTAKEAYETADAMITERDKPREQQECISLTPASS